MNELTQKEADGRFGLGQIWFPTDSLVGAPFRRETGIPRGRRRVVAAPPR